MNLIEQLQLATQDLAAADAEIAHLRRELARAARMLLEESRLREALEQEKERFRSIIDISPTWVWEVNADVVLTYVSSQITQLLGYDPGEVIGRSPFDFMPPEEADRVAAIFTPIAARHEPFTLPTNALRRKDGEIRVFEVRATPLFDDLGQYCGYRGINHDITAQQAAEETVRANEEKYRALVEQSHDGILLVKDVVVDCNDRALKMMGLRRDELLGKTPADFSPPAIAGTETFALQKEIWTRAYAGEPQQFPWRIYHKDGSILDMDISLTSITIDGEQYILATGRDVTERNRTEAALEQERALLSTGIDILPFPIVFITTAGEILHANRAAYELHIDEQGQPDNLPALQYLEPGTRRVLPEAESPEYRARHGEVITSSEFLLVMPDGSKRPVLTHAAPIYVKDELIGVVLALQDISALKAVDAAKDQFLMVLSHELKTPLTSIQGWAQAGQRMPEQAPRALDIIIRNAQEQARILDDLLDVSQLITKRLSLKRELIDFGALVQQGVESILPAAEVKHISLHTEVAAEPIMLMADASRILQVIGNLLTNAVKFTPPSGEIRVYAFRQEDQAVFKVQDTGRGIAPEGLPWLFRPFVQLPREEEKGGLGLGLSLVKGITELHGGHVQAFSPGPGQGSTFIITLPINQ